MPLAASIFGSTPTFDKEPQKQTAGNPVRVSAVLFAAQKKGLFTV